MATKPTQRLRGIVERADGGALMRTRAAFGNWDSPHMGASVVRKEIADWLPGWGSADADTLPDLAMLTARSRDLIRNHGIAAGAEQTQTDNIVGTGFRLSSIPDYRALGRDKEWSEEWSTGVESKWRAYANTREFDAAHCLTFDGLTQQIFRGGFMNGEALALPLWMPSDATPYSTKFQVIEADRLSNPWGQTNTDRLRGGIEIDQYGRPLAYWIRKAHPGDVYLGFAPYAAQWDRVPAETAWGRPRVIHVHDKERSGQNRSKPALSSVLMQFKMFDHYTRTELQAAIVNAMIAAFIETPMGPDQITEMFGGDVGSPEFAKYMAAKNEYTAPLKGGAIIPVFPGDKLSPFTPSRPAANFDPFTVSVLRHIAAGLNMPYELLTKDWSRSTYSSARAASLESWRFFTSRRKWLTEYWCTPAYEIWLEEAVNLGEVEAPGFYEARYAYSRCKWIGAGRGWVDPVKEAEAAQVRMGANLSSLEDECAEQGKDWEEVLEQRAAEFARMDQLGLPRPAPLGPKPPPGETEAGMAA